jgi:hypothetical protein
MLKWLDYVPRVTHDDVVRVIAREFPDNQRDVVALLDDYAKTDSNPERVQLAILKISRGRIDEVSRYVEMAKQDFRDVISPAEYPRYWELGTYEASQLSPEDREQLQKDDFRDYQEWLNRQ